MRTICNQCTNTKLHIAETQPLKTKLQQLINVKCINIPKITKKECLILTLQTTKF